MTAFIIVTIAAVYFLMGIKLLMYGKLYKIWMDIAISMILVSMKSILEYSSEAGRNPYLMVLFMLITLMANVYVVIFMIKYQRLKRIEVNRSSIREAFDDLPSGVCYFNHLRMPVLCNRVMLELAYEITEGKYPKSISALYDLETNSNVTLNDGKVWNFTKSEIKDKDGNKYIEIVAADITELRKKTVELSSDNKRLEQMKEHMNDLTKNVAAIAREEEMVSMKMKMHDYIGSCVLASRQFLIQDRPISEARNVLKRWKNTIGIIQRDNEYMKNEINRFQQLRESALGIGIEIIVNGDFPADAGDEYLIISATRECVTNTLKHAEGNQVYVDITYTGENGVNWCVAEITNNGNPPTGDIIEGVGLSGMRQRIERAGGTMDVISRPKFKMIVKIPLEDEVE